MLQLDTTTHPNFLVLFHAVLALDAHSFEGDLVHVRHALEEQHTLDLDRALPHVLPVLADPRRPDEEIDEGEVEEDSLEELVGVQCGGAGDEHLGDSCLPDHG